jgi:uncharacterized protein YcfL
MTRLLMKRTIVLAIAMFIVGCSSSQPNYRAAEQRANADKAQSELSREVKKDQ